MTVKIDRIYGEQIYDAGKRILVDRIWPRGVSKDKAALDDWLKEIGPTTDLRKWFGHDPEKFAEFKEKYRAELASGDQHQAWLELVDMAKKEDVLLLYAAKDEDHNQALILREDLEKAIEE